MTETNTFLKQCSTTAFSTLKALQPIIKRFAELGVMLFGCWLTVKGFEWSTHYADTALAMKQSDTTVPLVIGAVLAPLLAFTGAIVKMYLSHSNGNGHTNGEVK
jgi:hypothetical protein